MKWFTRHPGDRDLNRFADGELGERELARINDHLARCPRCREDVGLVRRMGQAAGSLPVPIATEEVLRRALARRAAGERVLLPTSDAGAPTHRPMTRFAPAAIAAMLTLVVASLVVSVTILEADRPALRFYPDRPEAGEALAVEYHGGALFADQTHLKLRARFRTAEDRHWQLLAGILVRGDDGLYRTEVQLPDSVVYAAFAVEDLHGERLDSNNRELWDVMVHGRDGRPTLDAMMARTWDLERRDWGEAYQQTIRMTEAYPDAPQSWSARFSYEVSLFDRDSVFAVHREQFGRLERIASQTPRMNAADMAWLGLYAVTLGEMGSGEVWVRAAVAREPYAHASLEALMYLWAYQFVGKPSEIHERVNELWGKLPSKSDAVANVGWQVALQADDPGSAQVWLARYLSLRPDEALAMAPRAYRMGEGVDVIRDWIENQVQTIEAPRPLHVTVTQHDRLEAGQRQRLFALMATEAYQSGDGERARRLAESGLGLGWESTALVDIARVLIATGNREAAGTALARAAADPLTATSALQMASSVALNTSDWVDQSEDARRALREHVMEGALVRYIDSGVTLDSSSGRRRLGEMLGERVTVLAFVSRLCEPAIRELPRIRKLATDLEAMGAQLLLISVDNEDEFEDYWQDLDFPFAVYSDASGATRAELLSSATPDYFVLDAAGRVRFEHSPIDQVLRQTRVLRSDIDMKSAAAD